MKQVFLYFYMNLILLMVVMIMIMISVSFLTLMERKFLGYMQVRKGPNKVGYLGMLQPFSDAIKLLSKESYLIYKSNYMFFYLSPMFSLILIMLMWMIYPFNMNNMMMSLSFLYLMCCFSMGVYGLLMAGWSSNSLYSMLGSLRSLAQSISYEVSLSIIMIIPMFLINDLDLSNLLIYQDLMSFSGYLLVLSMWFFVSIMAELNRTPFDFSEGESELVSGFNVEYSSSGFMLIFLAEYSSILFLSFLYVLMFWGDDIFYIMFYIKILILIIHIIWMRSSFPRFRYDLLMYFCWLLILPTTLINMLLMLFFKIYIYNKDNSK